jgi:flavin-dependent dehydrogenase
VGCDVAIIGAGPAGSTLAALLARREQSVALVEKDAFPRDKLCGEFLSPESMRELDRLGVLREVEQHKPALIRRARFTSASGRTLELELPGVGWGISRRKLDAILVDNAARCGARVLTETEAISVGAEQVEIEVKRSSERTRIDAGLVIGAHGRRQKIDRVLSRPFMDAKSPYVGMKQHHRAIAPMPDLDGTVEIHAFDGGYCGLCCVEDGLINVCALFEEGPSTLAELGSMSRSLALRLSQLEPAEQAVHAVAQVSFDLKERSHAGVLFAGDAAGMIAPLAGDGQAMALSGARILADLIGSRPPTITASAREELAARWDRAWRIHFEPRMRIGRALQSLLLEPRSADIALRTIGAVPFLGPVLARITRG